MGLSVRLFFVPLVVVLSSTVKDDPWPCLVYSRSEAGKSLIMDNDVNTSHQHYGNSGDIIQLAKDLGLTELVKLIDKAQLTDTLKSGTFTLIGPSNDAFGNLPDWYNSIIQGNSTVLKDLLRYHVIPGKLFTSSMHDGVMAISLLEGASVRFDRFNSDKLIAVTGAPISHGDNNATNGVIHVVKKVMWPIPTDEMVNVSAKCDRFTTLLKAAKACGIAESTMRGFPLTMFSPTNSAFDKLPPGTLDNLLKNTTELKTILSNHFVAGDFYAAGLQDGYRIRTIAGGFINVAIDGGVIKVNNATVTFADISVTNGVMHAIDTVLFLP